MLRERSIVLVDSSFGLLDGDGQIDTPMEFGIGVQAAFMDSLEMIGNGQVDSQVDQK